MGDPMKFGRALGPQAEVRRFLQHFGSFQVETALPKAMRDKLMELNRAVAAHAAKAS